MLLYGDCGMLIYVWSVLGLAYNAPPRRVLRLGLRLCEGLSMALSKPLGKDCRPLTRFFWGFARFCFYGYSFSKRRFSRTSFRPSSVSSVSVTKKPLFRFSFSMGRLKFRHLVRMIW